MTIEEFKEMLEKKINDSSHLDAPVYLNSEEAHSWCGGFDSALEWVISMLSSIEQGNSP